MNQSKANENTRCHALGLHMHQPRNNLRLLIEQEEWEAQQIIRCYERVARYAHKYNDVARIHVGFSGILLEQLRDPEIVDRYRKFVDIPAMLNSYSEAQNIELIGMGYYHPVFPLIPTDDWEEQLVRGRQMIQDVFGREPRGFWPPEMAFSMEMIPVLKKTGYAYVIVDGVHVKTEKEKHSTDIHQPYLAREQGVEIQVVPRDRDVSNAQESGMDAGWFQNEIRSRVSSDTAISGPSLITTWSDGENGGWFRQMQEEAGFFGHFFSPFMEDVRRGGAACTPVLLSEFLREHPPETLADINTGAWNVGNTSGFDFSQWAETEQQKEAAKKVLELSRRYWNLKKTSINDLDRDMLANARTLVLECETSCYLFWGDDWLPRLYERTSKAEDLLCVLENKYPIKNSPH